MPADTPKLPSIWKGEQVGVGSSVGELPGLRVVGKEVEHVLDDSEGMVAVEHSCPEICLPSEAPSGSHVASRLEGDGGCREEVGMAVGRDLVGGVEAVEMRDVAVLVLGIVGIDEPFLQLPVAAYLHGWELGEGGAEGCEGGFVLREDFCGAECLRENVEGDLVVHR